ncbi:MAG: TIGR04282 family arsenosugar biosynthesis glycosyltransferase [Nitrospirales bacterium]|nr:TIGR04282 family arsenosugar biosynthesis glycosyltransferase [Nitrospira sp.]MDR4501093.1 TIGR04282 family arsenosugar biosynthesis glycosyltransferase [Nitrospirales bacterium]
MEPSGNRKTRKAFHQRGGTSRREKQANTALIVFVKAPAPGYVKTRLCPPLTPDEAATLHGSLVLDTLEHTRPLVGIDRIVACAPSKQHPFFHALAARHTVQLWEQVPDDDLGQRMSHMFDAAFTQHYLKTMIIGSDLPTIDHDIIQQAVEALSKHDVVLGPAHDGGYYLIGLNCSTPGLFSEIPWSTNHVISRTQEIAETLGLTLKLLPLQRDLDTSDDLQYYIQESPKALRQRISSRTSQIFKTLNTRLVDRE